MDNKSDTKQEKKSWADQEEEDELAQKLDKSVAIPKEAPKDEDGNQIFSVCLS